MPYGTYKTYMTYKTYKTYMTYKSYIIAVRGKAPKVRENTDGGVLRLRLTEGKKSEEWRMRNQKNCLFSLHRSSTFR